MADIVDIYVPSFAMEDVIDVFYRELADAYASFLQTDNPTYGNRYHVLLRALRNMERFWEGD